MDNVSKDGTDISRRVMLAGTALTLGAATAAIPALRALAQQKLTQSAVSYRSAPNHDQRCDACVNFVQPDACRFVQGTISPGGWCELFASNA